MITGQGKLSAISIIKQPAPSQDSITVSNFKSIKFSDKRSPDIVVLMFNVAVPLSAFSLSLVELQINAPAGLIAHSVESVWKEK